jgi:ParB family chromosome partitioning protein
MSDRQAIVAMDIENRQRTDISPYERGQSYARWLREGYFKSQDDIGRALKISSSQVSRLLTLSRLPSVIVAAFDNSTRICEGWGLNLFTSLADPDRRQRIVHQARAIGSLVPRPPAREVYKQLVAASVSGRKLKMKTRDDVVKDRSGTPLFRIRQQSNSISLVLPLERISAQVMVDLREAVAAILQREQDQTQNSPAEEPGLRSHTRRITEDPAMTRDHGLLSPA